MPNCAHTALRTFVASAVVLTLLSATILAVVWAARAFGLSYYRIQTGSMEPDFPIGTIVVDSARAPIQPHRAITFAADGGTVTHVLVGYNQDGSLITRGIANAVNDDWTTPVYPRDVRGRVLFGIRLLAPAFWRSWQGVAVGAGLCTIVLAVYLWRRTHRRGFSVADR